MVTIDRKTIDDTVEDIEKVKSPVNRIAAKEYKHMPKNSGQYDEPLYDPTDTAARQRRYISGAGTHILSTVMATERTERSAHFTFIEKKTIRKLQEISSATG